MSDNKINLIIRHASNFESLLRIRNVEREI